MEDVPPGALQVFGRAKLAAGVGALDFGEISGKLRVPVLKQELIFYVTCNGLAFFLFSSGPHGIIFASPRTVAP